METIKQLIILKQIYSSKGIYDSERLVYVYPIPKNIDESDLESLEVCGHSPNQISEPNHNTIIADLKKLTDTWTLEEAASVFIAGLWSAPFFWRSALSGKLIAKEMPEHILSDKSSVCPICGFHKGFINTTQAWYSGFTSGIPLDGEPIGHVLFLNEMAKVTQKPKPTEYDCWTFRAILTIIRNSPPKTRYSKLRDSLKKENLLPTKDIYVYEHLLESLALIGVLDTPTQPGMITKFTTYKERDQRPNTRVEVQAPLAWWDSTIGINEINLEKIFSAFDCSSILLTNRPEPNPKINETIIGRLDRAKVVRSSIPAKSRTAGKGPVEAGDVYAIRIREGVWVTAFCHQVEMTHSLYAKMEYLDGVFEEMPTEDQLKSTFIGRRDGRWQQWCSAIDKTSWVRRVTRNFPVPQTNEAEPDRIPSSGAKNLIHLANWCFRELNNLK